MNSGDARLLAGRAHRACRRTHRDWIGTLSKDVPVVTLCVYDFHIGCQSAATLRKAGFDARYMAGGHYTWKALKGRSTSSNEMR
jgi:Fe-Mn family superoxide dismutase